MKTVNEAITHKAVDVIHQHFAKNKKQPLFLYFPTSAIHRPCLPTFTKGKSQSGLRDDTVVELDWTVNEVIKALKENRAYDNTLLIFTSDNGPHPGDPAIWINRYKNEGYEDYQEYFGDYVPENINEKGNQIWRNGWLTYGQGGGSGALVMIQDEWKFIELALPGRWPETYYPDDPGDKIPRLFHLKEDISENVNLYDEMPDKAAELIKMIEHVRTNTKSE